MTTDTTVVIPTIPPRAALLLGRALPSVFCQTLPAAAVVVVPDLRREGAGGPRSRGLASVQTPWTAFLDDDDELLPDHLVVLHAAQHEHDADVVYPWFRVVGGTDPFPEYRGVPWDPASPHIFPITYLVRTELAQRFSFPAPLDGRCGGEDRPFIDALNAAGAKIVHVDVVTWLWHHDSGNTSGSPTRWQKHVLRSS